MRMNRNCWSYLDPGLAGHVPFLHLVASQRTSSVVLRRFPAQVDVLPGHLQDLEVLWSTGCSCRNEPEEICAVNSFFITNCFRSD